MINLNTPSRFKHRACVIFGFCSICLAFAPTAQAETSVPPGTSVVLSALDDLTCDTSASGPDSGDSIPVSANCLTNDEDSNVDPRHLDMSAWSGLSTEEIPSGQRATAVATLINEISIPVASGYGGSEVLPVQIATEVSWSGILLAGGINSTFAQVVATLQVRNVSSGNVVASNTFLFERVDADLTLDVIDAVEGIDITNSSGVDITALLIRGQTYTIEIEAKCDISVPLLGAAACSFWDGGFSIPGTDALFDGDGFDVDDITVTVATDPVEIILSN